MRRKGGKEEKEEKEDWETGIYCLTTCVVRSRTRRPSSPSVPPPPGWCPGSPEVKPIK